jgi:hypothetical protein
MVYFYFPPRKLGENVGDLDLNDSFLWRRIDRNIGFQENSRFLCIRFLKIWKNNSIFGAVANDRGISEGNPRKQFWIQIRWICRYIGRH